MILVQKGFFDMTDRCVASLIFMTCFFYLLLSLYFEKTDSTGKDFSDVEGHLLFRLKIHPLFLPVSPIGREMIMGFLTLFLPPESGPGGP